MKKHDFENSLITIKALSVSMEPIILAMIKYMSSEKVYHVVSESKLLIAGRAIRAIVKEAENLEKLAKQIEFIECGDEQNHD